MEKATKLSDLVPDSSNYNKHSAYGMGLLEKSMRKDGFVEAGLISEDNVICSGNARQETAINIGMEDVQIIDIDGTKPIYLRKKGLQSGTKEFKELALQLNAVGKANVVFDAELIEAELGVAVCEEWGVEPSVKLEAEEDEFDVPVGGSETDIVLGDLFEIGQHRLICGDSTQTDTFKVLFGEQMADLVLTDPPYNVDYSAKNNALAKFRPNNSKHTDIANDSMADGDFYQFLYDFYTALGSYTKAGGAWYVWHADSEGANFRTAMKDAGIMVKQCLIWVKQHIVIGRQDYQWKHEPCLYGWKEGAAHGWFSDRKQTTVLNFDKPQRNAEHPTMKPIPLFSYQIGNSSKQGDIVADGFGGSGTTMVACHQMNRKAYLCEFDPKYCQVILDRMIKLDPTLTIKKNGEPYTPSYAQTK